MVIVARIRTRAVTIVAMGDCTVTLAVTGLGCPGGVTNTKYPYIYLTRCLLVGIKISASAAPSSGCDFSQLPFTFPALFSNTHRRLP